jgi:hypothetical protein
MWLLLYSLIFTEPLTEPLMWHFPHFFPRNIIRNYGIIIRDYEIIIRNYEIIIRNYEILIEILIRFYEIFIRNYEIFILFLRNLIKGHCELHKKISLQWKGLIYKPGSMLPPNTTIICRMIHKLLYWMNRIFEWIQNFLFFPTLK